MKILVAGKADAERVVNVASDNSPPKSASSSHLMLIDYLAARDAPCPVCRYNLRGLERPRCPECGCQLELSVRATDVPLGIWITALVAMLPATPFGVGVICSVYVSGWRQFSIRSADEGWWLALAIYAVLVIPGVVVLIAGRRRFFRMPAGRQAALAAIPIAFDVAAIVSLLVVATL